MKRLWGAPALCFALIALCGCAVLRARGAMLASRTVCAAVLWVRRAVSGGYDVPLWYGARARRSVGRLVRSISEGEGQVEARCVGVRVSIADASDLAEYMSFLLRQHDIAARAADRGEAGRRA